ncbi:uncharacterized protein TNCV_2146551 [Trichonephila clavipes]|uniref:Transposase n=1 Tax=Trichonephila clavipes TaxID=2585209 RepID=A0A8X6T2I9_TRICX|nr:uncharacterized protein TNCV_2146551 [Trichonephila clavipes]
MVNVQRYLTLLRETVVPCLIKRGQIVNVTFMQDGATSHTANPIKAFLIQTFGEDRIVSRRCRYPWPPRSPDLAPADFWLWGYLKSRVNLSGPSSLSELEDAIRREVSSIHPDVLHSTVAGFVICLECLLPCGGGHVVLKCLEETGKLEDRARAGRPCLKEARAPCIAVEMEAIASEAASGTNSVRDAARRLGLPPSSVRNILRRIL